MLKAFIRAAFLFGVLPFFISNLSFAGSKESRIEFPAVQLLEQITQAEKLQPQRKDVDALRYKPFDWEPSILPGSVRSWMMLELDERTIGLIQRSPDI
jgi:hypothetical protein